MKEEDVWTLWRKKINNSTLLFFCQVEKPKLPPSLAGAICRNSTQRSGFFWAVFCPSTGQDVMTSEPVFQDASEKNGKITGKMTCE
ncbi:MAG: hypothetical protein PHF61_09125 [Bacteroidales bacterium]|nr:hypothetical protein [Bacteroidales bacterium]